MVIYYRDPGKEGKVCEMCVCVWIRNAVDYGSATGMDDYVCKHTFFCSAFAGWLSIGTGFICFCISISMYHTLKYCGKSLVHIYAHRGHVEEREDSNVSVVIV